MNKDELTYLSIAKEPYKLNYAVFKGKSLVKFGIKHISYKQYTGNLILEIKHSVKSLIDEYGVDIVVSHLIDEKLYLKPLLIDMTIQKTMVEYTCLENNILYIEFQTYGWERRLTRNVVTNFQKVKIINRGYGLKLTKQDHEIANAIILGEGVAHNVLQIGRAYD